MADVKWIKLSTNMFQDEKIRLIESLPEADTILIIWVKLLAQAGKTNASGYIYLSENIPFTDEMLATIFNRPLGTVRLALKTFEQFGMIEINDNHFISISNWEKHQNIDGMEKIREQNRLRKQKEREKKKCLSDGHVTVTQNHATDIDIDIDIDKEIDINTNNNIISEITTFWDLNGFGLNNINSKEKLLKYLDEDLDGQVVLKALEIAVDMNKVSYSYVEKILKNWISRGVKSLNDVQALQKEYELQKKKRTGTVNKKPTRTEHLPDWYHDQDNDKPDKPLTEQDSEKMKAIEERIKNLKKEQIQ